MSKVATETLAGLIIEFIEAVTHQILYLRQIYSRDIFEKEKLYGLAVQKSRHPELNLYIANSVASLKEAIIERKLRRAAINVLDPGRAIQERYVVALQVGAVDEDTDLESLEAKFRAAILKLQYADSCMKPLPQGCTFEIEAHTTDDSSIPLEMWVESDSDGKSQLKSIVPIKSSSLGDSIKIQLHAEIA